MTSLIISEIFKTIQGESSYSGLPCIIIRLSRCNLNCLYCDTLYARSGGKAMSIQSILNKMSGFKCKLALITGGEPLIQEESLLLMKALINKGYKVLLETNGSIDIAQVPPDVVKIMDIKTPGSGMSGYNLYDNIRHLDYKDEVKFVITNRVDYLFAKKVINKYALTKKCKVLMSPVDKKNPADKLASWIIRDNLEVRLNLQLHKIIWPKKNRGV